MVPTTVPGRDLLDVIATTTNPKLLEVLKANPWLLNLIAQERERQEWEDVGPTAGPAAPSAAAPAGVTAPAPPAAAPPGEAAAEGAPPSAAPEITALKTRLQPIIAKMVRKPQLFGTPRGKAAMEDYLKLEEAEGKAEERAGKAQERTLKATTAKEEQQFRNWALAQAQAHLDAGDQQGAEDYVVMSRNPQLGVQIMKDRREREQEAAEQKFFTGLAEKEPDPDRKRLFEIAAVSKGVRAEAIKALKPEDKPLTDSQYSHIHDTGIDPRTRQPASPELRAEAKASVEGRLARAKEVAGVVAGAQAGGRAGVALQQPIGDEANEFADDKGIPPKPNTRKETVYRDYVNIKPQERTALQSIAQLDVVFGPKVLTNVKKLFPSDIAVTNQLYQQAIAEGLFSKSWFRLPGIPKPSAKELPELQASLAQLNRMNQVATMVARAFTETGNVATADTQRVTAGIIGRTTWPQFEAAIQGMREAWAVGKDTILQRRGASLLNRGQPIVIQGVGKFEEVP
jgi:hypothetical protein